MYEYSQDIVFAISLINTISTSSIDFNVFKLRFGISVSLTVVLYT